MTKKINVGIMGGTGYAAAELIKRLINHPHVKLTKISSIDHVGENIGNVHKNFGNRIKHIFEDISATELAQGNDLIFLTLYIIITPIVMFYKQFPVFSEHCLKFQ